MKCPYDDCDFKETKAKKFKHIRTNNLTNQKVRGLLCPECKRSFVTIETPKAEPFYKRESKYGYQKVL